MIIIFSVASQFELFWRLHAQELFSLVEFVDDLVGPLAGTRVPVSVRLNDAFESLRVRHRLNALLIVAEEVVVELDASRFLFLDNKLSNFQEKLIDFRQLVIELSC